MDVSKTSNKSLLSKIKFEFIFANKAKGKQKIEITNPIKY